MKFTISSLAQNLQVDYLNAERLVKFLLRKKWAVKLGENPSKKAGRREHFFEGPNIIQIDLTGRTKR